MIYWTEPVTKWTGLNWTSHLMDWTSDQLDWTSDLMDWIELDQ